MRKPVMLALALMTALLAPLPHALAGGPGAVADPFASPACGTGAALSFQSNQNPLEASSLGQFADPNACCNAMYLECVAVCACGVRYFSCQRVDLICEWTCDCINCE